MNVTVPFTLAFAVYVNVYLFPFVVLLTVALLNVTCVLLNVTAPLVKLVVFITLHVEIHVNATVPVHPLFIAVLVGCVLIVQLGAILSTVTTLLVFAVAPFHAVSFTVFAAIVNAPVPFTFVFAVYVNVNVLHVVVQPTVALLNVNNDVAYVIFPLVNAFVAIHTASVHVNTIVPASHLFISTLLGVHQLHAGTVVSTTTPLLVLPAAPFHAVSFTLFDGNVNFTSPFTFAFAV